MNKFSDFLIPKNIYELLQLITVIIAIFAIVLAWGSFNEAKKARQDIFLPVIVVDGTIADNLHKQIGADVRNIGKGVAFNVEVTIEGLSKYSKRKTLKIEDTHRWSINPIDENDAREINSLKGRKRITLLVSYEDIHHRKIKTKCYGYHESYKYNNKDYSRLIFDLENFEYCTP